MNTPLRALLFAAAALPALAPTDLFAAETPTTVDTVIVTGARNPEDPPVVGDARKRLSETPGAVSVISAESYEKRFAIALDDMLDLVNILRAARRAVPDDWPKRIAAMRSISTWMSPSMRSSRSTCPASQSSGIMALPSVRWPYTCAIRRA